MIIDFHIHGKITSTFPFSIENFKHYIEEAKNESIGGFALIEHCHADNFEQAHRYLENNYKHEKDYFIVDGTKVFVGTEVTTSEKLDFLFIGKKEDTLDLRKSVVDVAQEKEFININKLFEIYCSKNMLVILAHPYRKHEQLPELSDFVLSKIDAIECNATDLYKKGIQSMTEKIEILSQEINKPIVAGSDSHYFLQFGSVKNIFEKEVSSVQDIKNQIKDKNFKIEISYDLNLRVKSARIIKKLKVKNNDME